MNMVKLTRIGYPEWISTLLFDYTTVPLHFEKYDKEKVIFLNSSNIISVNPKTYDLLDMKVVPYKDNWVCRFFDIDRIESTKVGEITVSKVVYSYSKNGYVDTTCIYVKESAEEILNQINKHELE